MKKNTTTKVVSPTLVLKKLLKSCGIKVKTFFKTKKIKILSKLEDLFTSDMVFEFFLTPRRSRFYRNAIKPAVIQSVFAVFNMKIMRNVENRALSIADQESFANIFSKSLRFTQFLYILGIIIKISAISNGCSTIRETSLSSFKILTKYDSKNKIMKRIEVNYVLKINLLNFFNAVSIELKILDLLHYLLALAETRRLLQRVVSPKFLRQIDFVIFLVIIVIQILFTILDSINLNSSKNDFTICKDYMSNSYNSNLFIPTRN